MRAAGYERVGMARDRWAQLGSEHAESWVWLHAAGFAEAPEGWLELVLARIKVGRARLPWTAMGALSLGGDPMPVGGLGRWPLVGVPGVIASLC